MAAAPQLRRTGEQGKGVGTAGGRYVVRLTPADVGGRVTVRSRLPEPVAEATTTDTIGLLRSWRGGVLEIERGDGTVAHVAEADVVAARPVPPAPERRPRTLWVEGRPAAALRRDTERAWRAQVAQAGRRMGSLSAVTLDFTLAPGRWVDLDSLVEVAVAGLRDGGSPSLDVLVATKREGAPSGVTLGRADPAVLAAAVPPGPEAVNAIAAELPLPGRREAKRALRERLAEAWAGPVLEGEVWADLAIATTRSLLPAMEPALDTLEPVLGRDPRGQPRQEFFPFDDRIVWLRVRRIPPGDAALTLTLGPVAG